VTEEQFALLFGVTSDVARQVFVSQHSKLEILLPEDANNGNPESSNTSDPNDEPNLSGRKHMCEDVNRLTGEVKITNDANLFDELLDELDYSLIKDTMFEMVINYFRGIDFDSDTVRQCIYLSDSPIRSGKGNKCRYKLSRSPREIEGVIEENLSLLIGPYPFKIFRPR